MLKKLAEFNIDNLILVWFVCVAELQLLTAFGLNVWVMIGIASLANIFIFDLFTKLPLFTPLVSKENTIEE